MNMNMMMRILKKFNDGEIAEQEVLTRLEDIEPFYFYAALIKLYEDKGIRLEKGDSPSLSKLFQKLHKEELEGMINDLENGHLIKEMMREHGKFETLLDMLQTISEEMEDNPNAETIERIEITINALNHLERHFKIEEELIFPAWHENKEWEPTVSFLLEDEHQDILKTYEKLIDSVKGYIKGRNDDWREFNELIDELMGEISFHTFHEGDIFYPIVVEQLSPEKFDKIREKMSEIKDENKNRSLDEYINYLSNPILSKDYS